MDGIHDGAFLLDHLYIKCIRTRVGGYECVSCSQGEIYSDLGTCKTKQKNIQLPNLI